MTLPTGTVTFLFTDIEGSTRLVAEVGDAAYSTILDAERRLVLDAARAEGGVPFGSEGDAHFVAFTSAAAGLRAAVAAQRALGGHAWPAGPVRVRMGLHAGEVQVVGDDYVGLEVHRASRVAAAAHGGQVLATDPVRALGADGINGISLFDLGEHRLKDLARPERLFQVHASGLDAEFPALRTLDAVPHNLPQQLTSFVGRAEVEQASRLLSRTRLLTLTGPGGTGKTRLSLALAAECAERFPGGAWFVPLAPVTDPGLVASAIASAMGVLAPGREPIDRVREHLRERTSLLVLDNFEQVVAGAPVVADLLRAAEGLTVIVSSRAPLRIAGEQEFPVPPLSLPEPDVTDPDRLLASEAVRLFVERAMAVRPSFALTGDNGRFVAEIVRRLDGLPLAIELAAARIRLLSPSALARRLGDRLDLLEGGSRDVPERQRTLRSAIGWSHDLLAPGDQALFARLAVFAGGGPLEVVEDVAAEASNLPESDVLAGLERLAEQSLVRVEDDAHGDPRFAMLETIREYALERLAGRGETEALRDRHAAAFVALVARSVGAAGDAGDEGRGHWLDRLEDEHDNLRAALDHLVTSGDHLRAARLAHAMWRFWQMRGHLIEGRSRVAAVLAMPGWPAGPSIEHLRALDAAGGLAYWAGDMGDASVHYGAAVVEARALGDEAELANALYNRFFARRQASGIDEWIAALADDDRSVLDEALGIWTRLGDEAGIAKALWALGEHLGYRGEYAQAGEVATAALERFERLGDTFWIAWAHFTRAFVGAMGGSRSEAAADLAAALRDFRANNDVSGMALVVSAMASLLLLLGREREAQAIGGAARRMVAETGLHLAGLWPQDAFPSPDPDPADAGLRAAMTEGASWSRDDAVDRTLGLADDIAAAAI